MNIKRILLAIVSLLIFAILIFIWMKYNEGGSVPYPISLGSFFTIKSSPIDPTSLLNDVKNGNEPILQIESGFPEYPTFIMLVGWSQNDYLEIAQTIHKVIWDDDLNEWHLYRAIFNTTCENTSGKFGRAELYYYQDVKVDGKRKYSVHNISIEPEYGYIAWGGDSFYPRPLGGWANIDLKNIANIPAEKALRIADQQGGSDFREQVNNVCRINVIMWPWGYDRSDWKVDYRSKSSFEIWIPSK